MRGSVISGRQAKDTVVAEIEFGIYVPKQRFVLLLQPPDGCRMPKATVLDCCPREGKYCPRKCQASICTARRLGSRLERRF